MIKLLLKYRSLVVAIFVLAPLLFWFTYSEIGQFTAEKERPVIQDYCETVKATKAETVKILVSGLFKLKVEKTACMHCIDESTTHYIAQNNSDIKHIYKPQKTTSIYLYNSVFLI